jgi:hypothetical protein
MFMNVGIVEIIDQGLFIVHIDHLLSRLARDINAHGDDNMDHQWLVDCHRDHKSPLLHRSLDEWHRDAFVTFHDHLTKQFMGTTPSSSSSSSSSSDMRHIKLKSSTVKCSMTTLAGWLLGYPSLYTFGSVPTSPSDGNCLGMIPLLHYSITIMASTPPSSSSISGDHKTAAGSRTISKKDPVLPIDMYQTICTFTLPKCLIDDTKNTTTPSNDPSTSVSSADPLTLPTPVSVLVKRLNDRLKLTATDPALVNIWHGPIGITQAIVCLPRVAM